MARTLRIETAASPSLLLQRARRAARANGVLLLGDENSGRFSHGMLEGNYRRQGPTVILLGRGEPARKVQRADGASQRGTSKG